MNTKEKHLGTKAQIRAIFLAFILLIVIFSSYFTYNFLNPPQNQTTNPTSSQLKAAIVDHLSLTYPNQTFIQTATNTLKQAGYTVDYYPGEKVTVEFYRNLPTHGYKIIILRVHSALSVKETSENLALFTSQLYSKAEYIWEQLNDQVVMVRYFEGSQEYFGISPKFIQEVMNGRFEKSVIIMVGCYGLTFTKTAEAFIDKGAKVYISWNWTVSSSHTDLATIHLLQHFVTEKQTIKKAVDNTMKEVGPDSTYKSVLLYYPSKVGEQTIENIKR